MSPSFHEVLARIGYHEACEHLFQLEDSTPTPVPEKPPGLHLVPESDA